ncbi:shikimate dehydrogenase family protein [Actinomyces minihominis]|uniref:shikimate dehydrogenase family protein n=1 Tax=Actinomyces minihominis TaxID=2002838 RepID=UPI000C07D3E3|nr:shikimate dehydrogenase [Actinomyces minihominis]
MTKWAAVIGSPIEHSLSPVLHSRAFSLLGLDWEYRRYEVGKESLASFFSEVDPNCVGLSVTAPLKQALLGQTDVADGLAKLVECANTVAFLPSMSAAFNTDVQGIVDAIVPSVKSLQKGIRRSLPLLVEDEGGPLSGAPAPVVLGTGATASSALAALKSIGATRVYLVGRSFAGAQNAFSIGLSLGLDVHTVLWKVADRFVEAFNEAPVMISTVPPAATEEFAGLLTPGTSSVLLDVTYSGGESPLEAKFRQVGATVTSPLMMLTHQGLAQVKIWTSRDVPFQPVYEAVLEAAARR